MTIFHTIHTHNHSVRTAPCGRWPVHSRGLFTNGETVWLVVPNQQPRLGRGSVWFNLIRPLQYIVQCWWWQMTWIATHHPPQLNSLNPFFLLLFCDDLENIYICQLYWQLFVSPKSLLKPVAISLPQGIDECLSNAPYWAPSDCHSPLPFPPWFSLWDHKSSKSPRLEWYVHWLGRTSNKELDVNTGFTHNCAMLDLKISKPVKLLWTCPGWADCMNQCEGDVFVEDRALCHTTKLVVNWFGLNDVKLLTPWPGNSLDLIPIKNLWAI